MQVRKAIVTHAGAVRFAAGEMRTPRSGEALVAVEWAGVCDTDLMAVGGPAGPVTPGHEVYGRVVACPGGELAVGTPVIADPWVPCGGCRGCAGDGRCARPARLGVTVPGGYATHCLLPVACWHPVPETVPGALAVLAEPLAHVLAGLARMTHPPARMLIAGYGAFGALTHAEAVRRWPRVAVTVADPTLPDLAAALGAHVIPRAGDGAGFELVVAATGAVPGLGDAGTLLPLPGARGPASVSKAARNDSAWLDEAGSLLAAHAAWFRPVVTDALPLSALPELLRRPGPSGGKTVVGPWLS